MTFGDGLTTTTIWTNDSTNVQTYGERITLLNGIVNLGNGDGTGVSLKTVDSGLTSGSYLYLGGLGTAVGYTIDVTINGPGTMEIAGELKGGYGTHYLTLNTDVIIDGCWTPSTNSKVGTLYKNGPGTLIFNGNTAYGGNLANGKAMNVNYGAVRLRGASGLGTSGTVTMPGGEFTGRLELENNITMPSSNGKSITLKGRDYTNDAVALLNYSGNNTVEKTINLSSGDEFNYNIGSASGTLTISSDLVHDNTGFGVLNFSGAGNIEVSGSITDDSISGIVAAVRKFGDGTLTLSSFGNTFTGPLVVKGGAVVVSGSTSYTSAYHVGSGTLDVSTMGLSLWSGQTLSGSGTVTGNVSLYSNTVLAPGNTDGDPTSAGIAFTATPGTLTLNNDLYVDGGTLQFDLDNVNTIGGGVNDLISMGTDEFSGNLSLWGGTVDIHMISGSLKTDTYRLIDYTGSLSGGASYLSLTGTPPAGSRQSFALDDSVAHQINLVISGEDPKDLTWVGDGTANAWNFTAMNWTDGLMSEKFYNGDSVTFNDSGANNPPVNLTGTLEPSSITVNNPTKAYTFGGTGAVNCSGGLTKEGDAKLTIANDGPNTFGGIQINAGTVAFAQGSDSELTEVVSGSGTLSYEGTHVLTLSGANTGFTGSVAVVTGTVKVGNAAALGDTVSGTAVSDGATLDLNGTDVGSESITIQGAGVGSNGALVNTNIDRADVGSVSLAANATVGGTGTNDRTQGLLSINNMQGNNHNLTKVGSNTVQFDDSGETALDDIALNEGNLLFYGTATLGNQTKKVTIANNAILSFYDTTATHEKPIEIDSTGGQIAGWKGTNTVDSPVTMNGNLTLLINEGSLTLNGALTGTGNLDRNNPPGITGVGTVYLVSDDNDYTGTTTITSGNLSVGTGGATGSLGGTGDITLGDSGTLRFYRWGTVDVSRNIVGTGTTDEAVRYGYGNHLNFQDAVYNVSGNNSYTGDTWVRGGTVVLSNATGLGDAIGKTVIDNDSDVIACVALSDGITVAENFEMQPRASYQPINTTYAPHIQNLSGHNTLTGIVGTGTGGGGSQYTISSEGTETGDLLTISGSILCERPNASCGLWLRGPGKGEVTGSISILTDCNWTNLAIADGGTWTFYNTNYYSCETTIVDGTLALGNIGGVNGTLGSSPLLVLESSSSTLDLSGMSGATTLDMSYGMENVIGVGAINGNVSTGFSSQISPSGPMTATVLGEVSEINLAGGTLNIQGDLVSPYGGESLIFKLTDDTVNNDKIAVSTAVNLNGYSLTKVLVVPGGTLAGNYTLLTASSINVGINGGGFVLDPNHNTRYSMSLSLNPTLNPTSLVLSVDSSNKTLTWTGGNGTTWNSVAWDGYGYSGGIYNWQDVNPDDEMFYQGDDVVFGDGPTNTIIDLSGTLYPASVTVNSSQDYTFQGDGRLSSVSNISKSGSGTLTIANTGRNDYTGTVTITGGTLIPGKYALGSTAGGTIVNGGTLDLNGYYTFRQEPISVQGAGDASDGAIVNNHSDQTSGVDPYLYYVTLTGNATIGGTYDWSIQGKVPAGSGWDPGYLDGGSTNHFALTKAGANDIELADLGDTNLGDINVTEGTLTVSGNTDLGASTLTLSGGAKFKLSDATETVQKTLDVAATGGVIDNDSGDSTIAGTGGTLDGLLTVLTASETTLTLGNALSGTGGLAKVEDGTLVLSGANTYEGVTTITGGVLELVAGGQIDTDSLIINTAELHVTSGSHTVGVIEGTGTTSVVGSASLTATSIMQGTLIIGSGGGAAAAAAPVPEPATWLLLMCGLLGFAGVRKIRFR
ncbi:MAG: autotransporter-associated beta strand repeat-containing protein [Pirellulales bacterium]|nr:autotransporter-associated beta strand repeat-containing protein [Pirellulales bacterium]